MVGLASRLTAASDPNAAMDSVFDGRSVPFFIKQELSKFGSPKPETVSGRVIESDWIPARPGEDGGDDNPSRPDQDGFWDRFQSRAFDQICKNIELSPGQNPDLGDYVGFAGKYHRRLKRYPNGKFALVENVQLKGDISVSHRIVEISKKAGVFLSLGAGISGDSWVVRPLESTQSCKELGKLLNVLDFKSVLPLNGSRIAKMQIGEIWKAPVRLDARIGVGLSTVYEHFPISISFTAGEHGRSAVSLYRMSEDKLRFRLRLDRARITGKSAQFVYLLPAAEMGLPIVETILIEQAIKLINRQIAREINRYLKIVLSLDESNREGKHILLEYILDPRDPAQMAALENVLKGDLNVLSMLTEMVGRTERLLDPREEPPRLIAQGLVEEHNAALGEDESFAGVDEYDRDQDRFRLMLPFLFEYQSSSSDGVDRYLFVDEADGEYLVHSASERRESAYFDIPFLGQMTKYNTQKTSRVFTYRDAVGNVTSPMAVYVQQEGFLRHEASTARDMVRKADEIIRLTGTRGEGINPRMRLPVDELFPPDELSPREPRQYRRGIMAFTVAFSIRAVQQMMNADRETVLKAYANSLDGDERMMMEEIVNQGRWKGGKLEVKTQRVVERIVGQLRYTRGESRSQTVSSLAKTAARIVQDLAEAAKEPDPEKQARAFSRILSGKAESGLKFDKILKVLVQLADPAGVFGELSVRVDKNIRGEDDIDEHLVLDRDLLDQQLLLDMSRARNRFVEPSDLQD